MTNGLRNHPGPTRIRSWADEQRCNRIHRRFWIYYIVAVGGFIAIAALGYFWEQVEIANAIQRTMQ